MTAPLRVVVVDDQGDLEQPVDGARPHLELTHASNVTSATPINTTLRPTVRHVIGATARPKHAQGGPSPSARASSVNNTPVYTW